MTHSVRFEQHYKNIIYKDLIYKQNYLNIMQVSTLKKINLNTTHKVNINDKKSFIYLLLGIEMISGQKPKITFAKKPIASYKLRKNQLLGCKVTLRGSHMYSFLDKFITIFLPRLREFNTLTSQSFQSKNIYSTGSTSFSLFPELEHFFDIFNILRGLNITVVTSSRTKTESFLLLSGFQLPLK